MASVGDIYQLRLVTTMGVTQEAIANFYYEVVSGGEGLTAEIVADELVTNVLPHYQELMPDIFAFSLLTTVNGMDNDDWNITNPSIVGNSGAMPAPYQITVAFRSPSGGPGSRYSYKRMPGGWSTALDTTDGSWEASFIEATTPFAIALGAQLEASEGSLDPVQITGGFRLGEVPVSTRALRGQWLTSAYPTTQKTRQNYGWVLAEESP